MKRYIFLAIVVAVALVGAHNVYADGPPDTLSQEAQAKYDALPADVQDEIDDAMEGIPAEDWGQLIEVVADLHTQNTNGYTMSSGGCAVNSSLWRSYSANRIYGSTLASCNKTVAWIEATVKLTNPSGGTSYTFRQGLNTSAVMAVSSQPYQSGRWRTYGTGRFPNWFGTAGKSRTF